MNQPAWRSVAKLIGVAIAKLWLQELARQLAQEQEARATPASLAAPTVPVEPKPEQAEVAAR